MPTVIQCSTGNVGRQRSPLIGRPDLELVGVHAAEPARSGGTRPSCAGSEPSGVLATDDVDALVGLGADCVVYTSQAETRPQRRARGDRRPSSRAGTNVVTTSLGWLVCPARRRVAARAARGGVHGGAARPCT